MDSGVCVDKYEKFVAKCLKFFKYDGTIDLYFKGRKTTYIQNSQIVGLIGEHQNASYFLGHKHIALLIQKNVMSSLLSLCHEIVHYEQDIENRFKCIDSGYTFEGKIYPHNFPYMSCPWEIEAFAKQSNYLEKFLNNLTDEELLELNEDYQRSNE